MRAAVSNKSLSSSTTKMGGSLIDSTTSGLPLGGRLRCLMNGPPATLTNACGIRLAFVHKIPKGSMRRECRRLGLSADRNRDGTKSGGGPPGGICSQVRVRARGYFLEGLLDLARLTDRAERRSSWRQSIVALGQATAHQGPAPLDGVDPAALVPAVRVALADGLVDDLDWLSPEAATVALYEIASALPQGVEKREIGRRVAASTFDGSADVFAAVATRMALGSGKGLSGPQMRARVALVLELPFGDSARVDGFAFVVASRRDLVKDWIARPSRGSLPARRLSGRLLERAAGEAARLAAPGGENAAQLLKGGGP